MAEWIVINICCNVNSMAVNSHMSGFVSFLSSAFTRTVVCDVRLCFEYTYVQSLDVFMTFEMFTIASFEIML